MSLGTEFAWTRYSCHQFVESFIHFLDSLIWFFVTKIIQLVVVDPNMVGFWPAIKDRKKLSAFAWYRLTVSPQSWQLLCVWKAICGCRCLDLSTSSGSIWASRTYFHEPPKFRIDVDATTLISYLIMSINFIWIFEDLFTISSVCITLRMLLVESVLAVLH